MNYITFSIILTGKYYAYINVKEGVLKVRIN